MVTLYFLMNKKQPRAAVNVLYVTFNVFPYR